MRRSEPGGEGTSKGRSSEEGGAEEEGGSGFRDAPDGRDAVRSAVVTVGDELLSGETVDTNAAWIGRKLAALGAPVTRRFTVGDDDEEIRGAVARAIEGVQLVVVMGGLGPTGDDRTKEAVADLLNRDLRLDPEILGELEARFRDLGYGTLPVTNRSQAELPEGAEAIPNPRGTAPGIVFTLEEALVVLLPGVPAEMKGLFESGVEKRLRSRFSSRLRPVRHRLIHTTGIAESVLAERAEECLAGYEGPVRVAFLPDLTGVDLRLTVEGVGPAPEAATLLDEVEGLLEPVLGGHRFHAESGDLVEALARALETRAWTLATAESCTGGLVAKRLTDRPGSSSFFLGGVVSYSNPSKARELGVAAELLERYGAVSEEVARAMVQGVTVRFEADCGIAITGIAGPGGGTEEKPVGTVWYAARAGERVEARLTRFPGDRKDVRTRSAQAALHLLHRMLRR